MARKNSGFTILELLFSLFLLGIMVLLIPSFHVDRLKEKEVDLFLERFQEDVLYIQNNAMTSAGDQMRIRFGDGHYVIIGSSGKKTTLRNYPNDVSFRYFNQRDIYFNKTGTIIYPRTIKLIVGKDEFHVVFQPGKGRFYYKKI